MPDIVDYTLAFGLTRFIDKTYFLHHHVRPNV